MSTVTDLPYILDQYGHKRPLGNRPTPVHLKATFGKWKDSEGAEILAVSDLAEFDEREASGLKIKDQNGFGACNGHDAATGMEIARYYSGEPYQELSAWYVYAILCNGVDQGSSIGDALTLLTDQGTCLDASVPYGTINPRKLTAANKAEAARFKIEKGESLTSWQEVVSAVMLRRAVSLSIRCGNNFTDLDSEFVPPVSRGYDNHAVAGGLALKKSAKWGWLVGRPNSWTTTFGDKGWFFSGEAHCQGDGFEAYVLNVVQRDPSDTDVPPVPVLA